MKILINNDYGGFNLSDEAVELYNQRSDAQVDKWTLKWGDGYRFDPILIGIVEELGERASGAFSKIIVDEVVDGYDYSIQDYDGIETVHLHVNEDHLRELIHLGNEDDIVDYVMKAN